LTAWRARLAGHHSLWSSALCVPLDDEPLALVDMALPLRVTERAGDRVLQLDALVGRRSVLIGPAGSGKSTALKLLFGAALAEPRCLPLLLDLRDWRGGSLDDWIRRELVGWVPEAAAEARPLQAAIDAGIRPMLLLDGWDELGDAGTEVHGLLVGLTTVLPALDVVVASRPGARGLPGEAQGYQVLRIQPFGDADVVALVERLLGVSVPPALRAASKARFLTALEANPAARALARRPLLLQMMLLLLPSGALPERRHRLYAECVETLLSTRDDSDAELAALTAVAWHVQRHGGEVEEALPAEWSGREQRAFLNWMCGPAGLLERRSGVLRWLHPALREYLAAAHLAQRVGSPQRGETARDLAREPHLWEVLRLWLALLPEAEAARLVRSLDVDPCLLGAIHADGLGRDEDFERWADDFVELLAVEWPLRVGACSQAWASRQRSERARLSQRMAAPDRWDGWLRVNEFVLDADLGVELEEPPAPASHLLAAMRGDCSSPERAAVGRILSGASPLWPGVPWQIALLQAWPSRRPAVSRWLQRMATLGASEAELAVAVVPEGVRDERWWSTLRAEWTGFLDDHGTYQTAEHWAHRLALTDPWAPDPLASDAVLELLADTRTPAFSGGVVSLMRIAAQARLGLGEWCPGEDLGEPLWPALARVIAGCARPGDVDLLAHLAAHPEEREGPLAWGLRYVVRGDVWLAPDRILRLEDLGVELPLVELRTQSPAGR